MEIQINFGKIHGAHISLIICCSYIGKMALNPSAKILKFIDDRA